MILSCPFALPIALLGNDTCKIRERRGKKKCGTPLLKIHAELQITKQIVIDSLLKLDKNKQADHLCGSVT